MAATESGGLVADGQVRCDDQDPAPREAERQDGDEPGLAAADRYLLDRALAAAGEELNRGGMALDLWLAQRAIAGDAHFGACEELGDVFVREGHCVKRY